MTNFQEEAINAVLRSELGKAANFRLYGRVNRTPMNFVLDEVERQIGPQFSVYWVNGGTPEVFTLPGFSPSPVVFSVHYLSLTSFIRGLLVNSSLINVLPEVTERTTLKLMAEMALRHGDPEYAVLAFVKSVTVSGWRLSGDDDDANQIMDLESGPINESYMATWFYGLVHELGHLSPIHMEHIPNSHLFSDAGILQMITVALDDVSYPDAIKHEAVERAKQQRSNFVLGIDQLRSEGLADIFAASVLFQATVDIMWEINQKRLKVEQFIGEMIIFLNIIAVIERCRRVASIASATITNPEAYFESLMHHISVYVRILMQRVYLEFAVASYLFDTNNPTPEQLQRVSKLINEINELFEQQFKLAESGMARATEFSLFPEQRENH